MKFNISYEASSGASEEYIVSISDCSKIEFSHLLQDHNSCDLSDKDTDANMWIRIPSIKELRCFLSAASDETVEVSIILSGLNVPFNQSLQSSSKRVAKLEKAVDFAHRIVNKRLNYTEKSKHDGGSAGNSSKSITMDNVSDIMANELLILPDDNNPDVTISLHAPSLLLHIKSEIFHGTHIYDITVQVQSEGKILNISLKKEIWTTYLLRAKGCSGVFLDFMATSLGNVSVLDRSFLELHQKSILWNKVKVFHNDLMTYGQSADAQKRLDSDPMAFCFMSSIYFTESELEYLHNFPTSTGLTCQDYLNALIRSKTGPESKNATLCTSHDLATAFAKIYGIRKEHLKEKQFQKFLKGFGKGK